MLGDPKWDHDKRKWVAEDPYAAHQPSALSAAIARVDRDHTVAGPQATAKQTHADTAARNHHKHPHTTAANPTPDNNITLSHAVSRLDTHVAWLQDLNERLGKALAAMRGAQPADAPSAGVIKDLAINHQMHGLLSEQSEQLEALGRRVDELTLLVGA